MVGERLNDSTRHLSAGAHLDAAFRNRIVREIYLDRSRRVAPSYGFDLAPLLIHARRALAREVVTDILLIGTVIVGFLLAPVAAAVVVLILALWYAVRAASRLSRDYVRYYFKSGTIDEYTHLKTRMAVLRWVWRGMTVVPVLLIVVLGLAAAGHVTLPLSLIPHILPNVVPGAIAALGAQLVTVAVATSIQHASVRGLREGSLRPMTTGGPRLRSISRQELEPITIYSRYRPFIGSGTEIRTWSFVQRLVQASPKAGSDERESEREWATPPFRTNEIVSYLKERLEALAWDPDPEKCIVGLAVRHHIFVAGTKTADLPEEIATADPIQVMADPTGHARHYLACQVESWDGEIVTTVYVHTSIQGKMLYLEFTTWALPPTREEFHVMDEPGGVGVVAYLSSVGKSFRSIPERVAGAPARLATHAGHSLRSLFRVSDNYDTRVRGIDIGCRLSARELGAGLDLDDEEGPTTTATIRYFQNRDVYKYAKVIERRLLASVLDYLEANGVNVSEYRQRMVSILNIGAVNYGSGTVNVTNTAIGEGATVQNN